MERLNADSGQEPRPSGLADSWREVGDQLRELGAKIVASVRMAWAEERQPDQEEAIRNVQSTLRETADRLERVARRVSGETEEERSAALTAARGAGEQSVSEVRAASISALRALNEQLEQFLQRVDREDDRSNESAETSASAGTPEAGDEQRPGPSSSS